MAHSLSKEEVFLKQLRRANKIRLVENFERVKLWTFSKVVEGWRIDNNPTREDFKEFKAEFDKLRDLRWIVSSLNENLKGFSD